MKNIKRYALFAVALLCLGQAAQAARRELTHEDVVIEKGQTVRGDVATDKSILVNGTLDGDAVSVGGASVTINGELTGDLVAIGGAIYIPGLVKGDVSGIGGPVSVSGKVSGDVASVGGGVNLSGTGEIDGGISVLGGSFTKGEKAIHKGEVHSFDTHAVRTVLPRVLRLVRYAGDRERGVNPWMVGGLLGLGLLFFFSVLVTGAILLLLPPVFFPKNVENMAGGWLFSGPAYDGGFRAGDTAGPVRAHGVRRRRSAGPQRFQRGAAGQVLRGNKEGRPRRAAGQSGHGLRYHGGADALRQDHPAGGRCPFPDRLHAAVLRGHAGPWGCVDHEDGQPGPGRRSAGNCSAPCPAGPAAGTIRLT